MTAQTINRRRFLKFSAACGGAALIPNSLGATEPRITTTTWRGMALGASAEIRLYASDIALAKKTLRQVRYELARLESIFSLYQTDSLVNKLNRRGILESPPIDLISLLSEARQMSNLTGGAFDVSVQGVWRVYEQHFGTNPGISSGPSREAITEALETVDFRSIEFDERRIVLNKSNMALTFNGIAQGYITDRVVDILKRSGFSNFVADLGEPRLVGSHPEGRSWRVGLKSPLEPVAYSKTLHVVDRAVATTASSGTLFGNNPQFGHLLNSKTGMPSFQSKAVSVVASNATLADGLSTAFAMMSESRIKACLRAGLDVDTYRQGASGLWTELS